MASLSSAPVFHINLKVKKAKVVQSFFHLGCFEKFFIILLYLLTILYFRLIECLKDLGEHDWQLAGMICQIFWNYSGQITTAVEYFGEEQVDDIITVLREFLGKKTSSKFNYIIKHSFDILVSLKKWCEKDWFKCLRVF